jgi:hypothetical protein
MDGTARAIGAAVICSAIRAVRRIRFVFILTILFIEVAFNEKRCTYLEPGAQEFFK